MAYVVFGQPSTEGFERPFLVLAIDGGGDAKPLGVGRFGIAFEHGLPHHFCYILGRDGKVFHLPTHSGHRCVFGRIKLLLGNKIQLAHSAQHIKLAQMGSVGVDHGVVKRRGFGQASQHRHFGNGQVGQRLAVVDLCRCGKAISALPQINLVEIQLQNLVFAQVAFDFERQQGFVKFAGKRPLGREEKVLGHLHGDG